MTMATTTRVVVNGLATSARVDRHLIHEVLLPRLREVSVRASASGMRRAYIFLAAPPGTGKSTLAALLEQEADGLRIQSIGIDGFHLPNSVLQSHTLADGTPLSAIKGAPETFDVAALQQHLVDGAAQNLRWPVYDRTTHDPISESVLIDAPLVLVEGNWLLLKEPGWRDVARHAAYSIFIDAPAELLADRLVARKIAGGMAPEAAREFVTRSDLRNFDRVLSGTDRGRVDLFLSLNADGTITEGEPR